jgi:hypothetical protein
VFVIQIIGDRNHLVVPAIPGSSKVGFALRNADAGSAGVGRYGLDRNRNRAKSSWLGDSRAGLRSVSGPNQYCANQLAELRDRPFRI